MKKTLSLLLTLCLMATLLCGVAPAQAAEAENEAVFAARAMGIMNGDENGNMNLGANVTRAEFAKMMVSASKYKDSVGTNVGVSLYKDVKSNHWASQYIKLAVEEGWFQGYVDGTFRPAGLITVEEGATVVLRALGYDSTSLQGAFPSAQLSKYSALGLDDGISKGQGSYLTRQDCAHLFYNLMGIVPKDGKVTYGEALGYTVTNGKVDYSGLVNANMKGPYLAKNGSTDIPINNPSVIKNGKSSSLSEIKAYDVYYYNVGMRTVWVYNDKAVGTLSAVSPNSAAPTSATVGGTTYTLSTSEAMFALSDSGSFRCGDTVTLLLDRSGAAAFVSDAVDVSAVYCGVVTACTQQTITTGGSSVLTYAVSVACTDGTVRTVNSQYQKITEGTLVSVNFNKGKADITSLSGRSMSGKFTSTSFAGKNFADDVEILDVAGTDYKRIWPERLSGSSVSSSNVSYYELNGNGEISKLILKNATGDAAVYGYMTDVTQVSNPGSMSSFGQYTVYINGKVTPLVTENGLLGGAVTGGVRVNYTKGSISSFKALTMKSATTITQLQAVSSGATYTFADDVQVYIRRGSDLQSATVSGVSSSDEYNYTLWVDSDAPAGGRVRILIATEIMK